MNQKKLQINIIILHLYTHIHSDTICLKFKKKCPHIILICNYVILILNIAEVTFK